jgi:cell wall-associated NlpC family hydrolase
MPRHSRLLVILLLAFTLGACAARGGVPRPFPGAPVPARGDTGPREAGPAGPAAPPVVDPSRATPPTAPSSPIAATALAFTGVPYRNGGSDPSGFDCSGFVQYVFAQLGAVLPREVRDQYQVGRRIDRDEIRAGDLVFFETVSRGASHVGVAIGDDGFVHAPSSRGVVRVERLSSTYWARRFVGVRRVEIAVDASARGD